MLKSHVMHALLPPALRAAAICSGRGQMQLPRPLSRARPLSSLWNLIEESPVQGSAEASGGAAVAGIVAAQYARPVRHVLRRYPVHAARIRPHPQ